MSTKIEEAFSPKPMEHVAGNSVTEPALVDDPFRYGWRTVVETQPDGKIVHRDMPLTQADFLNPQLGDHMVQSDPHFRLVNSLYDRFSKRYLAEPTTGVFSDLKMVWGIPGVKEPAPDIAIVPHLQRNKQTQRSIFAVPEEGARPCLIIEVISPRYPGDDTVKVEIYERVGVAEYIVINPYFEDETLPFELLGHRLMSGVYQEIAPDAQGRLLSETTGVWFGLDESGRAVVLEDAGAGERLLTNEEEHEARLAAEARAQAAEVEIARLRALLAIKNGRNE